jgi:peptide/nickel transport system substrate-binding protein
LLCISLFACGAHRREARDPHTIVILEGGDAGTIEPLLTSQYYSFVYQNLVFDTLCGNDGQFNPTPSLATAWRSNRPGTVWDVTLRRGVRWSDGRPFDSADVAWTFSALLDPATGGPYNGQYVYIKRVVAVGPYAVRFYLGAPNATFVANALQSQWIMPAHAFVGVAHKDIKNANFGEHPIGTGPYVLARWEHDQEAYFTTNPHWWGGTPNVRSVDIRILLQDQSRTDAMLQGVADFDDGVGADAADRLAEAPGIRQINIPDLFTRLVYINMHRPGLNDVAVRRAMLYGWDRQGLAAGLRHGRATVASSVEPAGLPYWHDDAVKPYPFDPRHARAILDAAGWEPGPDGVRRKGRTRLAYDFLLPNSPIGNDIAAAFYADMRSIGINITVQLLDYATFIDRSNASNFDLAYSGWGGAPDPDMLTMLDSKQLPPTGNNIGFYRNLAVDRDLERGLVVLDPKARRALYDDMQERTARDVPVLFGSNEFYTAAYLDRVHISGPIMPDTYVFNDLPHWRLDP